MSFLYIKMKHIIIVGLLLITLCGCTDTKEQTQFEDEIFSKFIVINEQSRLAEEKAINFQVNNISCENIVEATTQMVFMYAYEKTGIEYYNQNKYYFDKYCHTVDQCGRLVTNVEVWKNNQRHYADKKDGFQKLLNACNISIQMNHIYDETYSQIVEANNKFIKE